LGGEAEWARLATSLSRHSLVWMAAACRGKAIILDHRPIVKTGFDRQVRFRALR
jgi:hypothetical protein